MNQYGGDQYDAEVRAAIDHLDDAARTIGMQDAITILLSERDFSAIRLVIPNTDGKIMWSGIEFKAG